MGGTQVKRESIDNDVLAKEASIPPLDAEFCSFAGSGSGFTNCCRRKCQHPSATTILVVAIPVRERLEQLKEAWDHVISAKDIQQLIQISKKLLHNN